VGLGSIAGYGTSGEIVGGVGISMIMASLSFNSLSTSMPITTMLSTFVIII